MGRYLVFFCAFILFWGFSGAANAIPFSFSKMEGKSSTPASSAQKIKVIGNRDSKEYHLPGMKFYDTVEAYHLVEFDSEADAIKAGYKKATSSAANTTAIKDIRIKDKSSTPASAAQKIKVIGNRDTKKYHLPGMKFYDAVEAYHRVEFDSEADAIKAGYHKAPR